MQEKIFETAENCDENRKMSVSLGTRPIGKSRNLIHGVKKTHLTVTLGPAKGG